MIMYLSYFKWESFICISEKDPESVSQIIVSRITGLGNTTNMFGGKNNLFALCGLRRKRCGGRSTVEAWISNEIEREFFSRYILRSISRY